MVPFLCPFILRPKKNQAQKSKNLKKTYATSSASSDVIRQTVDVVRVAHEDGGLDSGEGVTGEGGAGAAAEGIVHDLPALGVADEDDLGRGAARVEGSHGRDHGGGALGGRRVVAHAAARRLAAARRVDDGLGLGARVGRQDLVHQALGGAVARRGRGLARAKDVDARAALALLQLDGAGGGEPGREDGEDGRGLHLGTYRRFVGFYSKSVCIES